MPSASTVHEIYAHLAVLDVGDVVEYYLLTDGAHNFRIVDRIRKAYCYVIKSDWTSLQEKEI